MTTVSVATTSGLHVLGGAQRTDFEGRDVNALHIESSGHRWALVDHAELWQEAENGWERQAASDMGLNCLLVDGSNVWIGAAKAQLLRLDNGSLTPVTSFDEAPGRDQWFTPWGGPPDVRSLTRHEDQLFVNVHVGGILRGSGTGSAWEPTIDIASDVHEVAGSAEGLVAATAWGFASSADDGTTWSYEEEGLHATYARAIAAGDEHVFMTACEGPFGGRSAIYRRALDGGPLAKCNGGLPAWFQDNIDTGCVAAAGAKVAFGTRDGSVFVSGDNGNSWDEVARELGPVRWVEFAPLD